MFLWTIDHGEQSTNMHQDPQTSLCPQMHINKELTLLIFMHLWIYFYT